MVKCRPRFCSLPSDAERNTIAENTNGKLYSDLTLRPTDPDRSQRFDHSGRNEISREPFPLAQTCDMGSFNPGASPDGSGLVERTFEGPGLEWEREVDDFLASLPPRVQDAAARQGAGERYCMNLFAAAQ